MKKRTFAFVLIATGFLVIAVLIANYGLTNYAKPEEKHFNNNSTKVTPTPSSPLPTISPFPSSSVSTTRTTFKNPFGSFEIKSPSNKTYISNNVILQITGFVIGGRNIDLSLSYSVDGQEKVALPIDPEPPEDHYSFIGHYSKSIAIAGLSDGRHWIVVFGDLKFNGVSDLCESIVYFTINQNPV